MATVPADESRTKDQGDGWTVMARPASRRKAVSAKERLCNSRAFGQTTKRRLYTPTIDAAGVLIWGWYSAPSWEPWSAVGSDRYSQSAGVAGGLGMSATCVPRLGKTRSARCF